jgi:hypothetical protein
MNDKPEPENAKEAEEKLNKKIEAIMGPTPGGEKPVNNDNVKDVTGEAEVKSAPELPADSKPQSAVKEPETQLPKEEDPELSKAVDDIAAQEADELLAVEDNVKKLAEQPPTKKSFGRKIKDFFKAWWGNPKARNATLIVLVLIFISLAIFPPTRYFMLNTVGVRSKASITVLDNSTQQPLKNVQVTLRGVSAKTDDNGYVRLEKVKLGTTNLEIKKRAFAPINKKITVGLGSNPLGKVKLEPSGVQYSFRVNDFLSNKPVEKAEAISGESSAFSDNEGKIVLTLEKEDVDEREVTIKARNYRDEKKELSEDNEAEVAIKMVPAHKHAFVSKRSGKLDVYKIDVDGTNEGVVLAGSGAERDDIRLAPHPTKNIVAVVSTRDNQRNQDGYLLSTLNLINLDTNKVTTVTRSERVEVVGWADGRFVFAQIAAGTSGTNPKRHRLMSFDPDKEETKELAAANYFNDVMLVANTIYYAPSSAYQNGNDVGLYKINSDGNNRQTIINKETWNVFRADYSQLTLAVQQEWFEYDLSGNKQPNRITPPANPKNRIYVPNLENKKSIWIDHRDGKGVLLVYNVDSKKETTVKTQSGLKYPAYWVSDSTIVYRINTDQETADYVLNLDGGEPKKIRDVTNTGGVGTWYYY